MPVPKSRQSAPRKHKKRGLPQRADGLSLRGVPFKDALRAAMATPLPPEMKRGGKVAKAAEEE